VLDLPAVVAVAVAAVVWDVVRERSSLITFYMGWRWWLVLVDGVCGWMYIYVCMHVCMWMTRKSAISDALQTGGN